MIKNTSGLAVQPCRLHERFYYHARLLYYILRQKARGFFDAGAEAPRYPLFSLCLPGGGSAGLVVPAPTDAGAPPCTRGSFLRDGSPSTQRCEGFPLCTPHERALRPAAPGDFLMRRKSPKTHQEPPGSWTSGTRGRTPLDSPGFCPSGIGCEQKGSRHPRGLPLPSHGLKTESVPSMKPEEKNKTDLPT